MKEQKQEAPQETGTAQPRVPAPGAIPVRTKTTRPVAVISVPSNRNEDRVDRPRR